MAGPWEPPTDEGPLEPQPNTCETFGGGTPCSGRVPDAAIPKWFLPGYVLAGRMDTWLGAPDFLLYQEDRYNGDQEPVPLQRVGQPKLMVRALILTDKGDSTDLALRRAGPDDSAYNGEPAGVAADTIVGNIYAQALHENADGKLAFNANGGFFGRLANIIFKAAGTITGDSTPGEVGIGTTDVDQKDITHWWWFRRNGVMAFLFPGEASKPCIAMLDPGSGQSGQQIGVYPRPYGIGYSVWKSSESSQQSLGGMSSPDGQEDTTLDIRWRPNSGSGWSDIIKVKVGAADSGGSGRRALTIPN